VRNHLFKNPNERISAEEAMHHPFVMPTIHMFNTINPIKHDDYLKPMLLDVELGDISYEISKSKMSDEELKEPHALKCEEVKWRHVANAFGITDESIINDILIITNGGNYFKPDDIISIEEGCDIIAMIVSKFNGIVIKEGSVSDCVDGYDESEWNATCTMDQTDIKCLNARLQFFNKFVRICRKYLDEHKVLVDNIKYIETVMRQLMNFDILKNRLFEIQQEVMTKFPGLPMIPSITLPSTSTAIVLHLPDIKPEFTEFCELRSKLKSIKDEASEAYRSGETNMTVYNECMIKVWEEHKDLLKRFASVICDTYKELNKMMRCLQTNTELFICILGYIQQLEETAKLDETKRRLEQMISDRGEGRTSEIEKKDEEK